MTALRDDRQTARDARRVALNRAHLVAQDLRTIPGWLLVGRPDRLGDTGLRDAAFRGVALRARLDEIHAGIAAIDAELDVLDGPQRASVYHFLEWSRWLESLTDAGTLLDQLVPDPRRRFLGAEPAMSAEVAQRMLDVIAANGGRVGDGQAFVDAAGLTDDDVWDLVHTARRRLDPLPDGHVIGVLLPMRLETRYVRPDEDGAPWRLRVRVHPDPVAVAGPALPPNRLEAGLVAACWTNAAGDLDTEAGAAAFGALAGAVGGARATFLLRTVPVVPRGDGFAAERTYAPPGDRRPRQRFVLPRILQLWADWGGGPQLLGDLRPQLRLIAKQTDLRTEIGEPLLRGELPDVWWTSYEAAERVGLATEVALPGGPHLDVLMVTGLSTIDARDVLSAHADHGDLGVIEPMSPSNTVAGAAAAPLGRAADWLEVARSHGAGTLSGLSGVLSERPRLNGVPATDTTRLGVVPALVTALWPVLWQRWLKDVERVPHMYEMGDWAARLLSPLGPWPAVRVGDVPYGILPAVDLAAWKPGPVDPVWEQAIAVVADRLVPAWAAAGTAGGTAAGASAEQLLDIIGRVPTSRQLGSRAFLPLEILVLLRAVINGDDPQQVVDEWEAMAAPSLGIEPRPQRRYQPFGLVQPGVQGGRSVGELLQGYLEMPAENLAYGEHDTDEQPLLVRLIRHSLLLTLAEAGRLGEGWATWSHPYVIPLHEAERLAQDAAFGTPVMELPPDAQERLRMHPPDPQAVVIARQFRDVREAVGELIGYDDALRPEGALAPSVAAVVDTSSHRLDPWVTALGTRRLRRLIERGVPRRIGAYGWVDDLSPATDPTPPTDGGLLHAPGHAQALAAAVLRDHAIHDVDDPRWRLTLRSDLARLAARLGADVRMGVHVSEALGRELERLAGEPGAVLDLRRRFPARPEWAGRRVCDGQRVLDADPATIPVAAGDLADLRKVVDTYGDLLVADAVHDVVSGRAAAAQESMEAAAGLGAPPELRLLRTRREGTSVRTTVLLALPAGGADPASPVSVADPVLARLLVDEVGPAEGWTWTTDDASVSLADLGLGVPDVVVLAQPRLDALAAAALGAEPAGGTAAGQRAALDRLCSLPGVQAGVPEPGGDPAGGLAQLRERLAALRAAAADLAALGDIPAGQALPWGLPDDSAADVLAARIASAGSETSDATTDAIGLGERIRGLLGPVSGLPLICTGTLPDLVASDELDREWLEIVAAVRPAVARLEAHQLIHPWPAASDPERLWAIPTNPSERHLVVYGPGVGAAGAVGLALLDDWAETVPSTRHTTHAAFGFDAPRARAQQAVLLAVPPDEQVPLTAAALPGIVMATRQLARARMAQPDQLDAWALAVPTSMVLASGPAGSTLTEHP